MRRQQLLLLVLVLVCALCRVCVTSADPRLIPSLARRSWHLFDTQPAAAASKDDGAAVAQRVGKSRSAVTNALRLLTLPASVQGFLADGRLSAGHAKALLGTTDRAAQERLAKDAVSKGWSVRATEDAVRALKSSRDGASPGGTRPTTLRAPGLLELESLLADYLATKVSVAMAGKRGRVTIDFADLEDLERIYRKMTEGAD